MKKIETEMNRAIILHQGWKKDNTEVVIIDNISLLVRLHGKIIAMVDKGELIVSSAGYPTRTTCSRLNALVGRFFKVNIKQGNLVLSKLSKEDFTIVEQKVLTTDFTPVKY